MICFQGFPPCPFCRNPVGFASIDARRPFRCPHCGHIIALTRSYGKILFFISLGIGFGVLAAFGLKGIALLIGAAVTCFPLMIGISPFLNKTSLFRLVPPQH